ncbi:NAD(P)-binding domain-containing protein [Roseimaritima ulvae]|uniref:Ferredoxin--NADP reductase n=1 Tax=Roseimaritima ulvae TaxID=980254 RepID=A0A5B9R9Y2_9BACT|nr:NAD(P)-binding domain-containing protein [Roseimaritima ulvae]QEG43673.1 Ferredoxin--NADP reductase [Roseimaritima ulvae]
MNRQPTPPADTQAALLRTRVVIVGAGPIGLELAVALQRQQIPFEIVEAGAIGQTISWWAPETRWFSSNERIAIAGVPLLTNDQAKATREQYLTYLRGIVAQFGLRVRSYQPVVDIVSRDEGFRVITQAAGRQQVLACQAVVLACGGTDTPRRLGIPGEDLPHVDGYLREPHRYVGRRVLIIGGRNSAVEAALRLHHAGANVSISYRGEALPEDGIKYWLLPEIRGLCNAGRITPYLGTRAVEIHPDHVVLESTSNAGQTTTVPTDDVLSLIGYEQDKTLFKVAGIELIDDSQRPRIDEQTMQSSVPGIYVAGTAVAGTQNSSYKIFLENCHQHIDRIVAHLTGQAVDVRSAEYERQIEAQPES